MKKLILIALSILLSSTCISANEKASIESENHLQYKIPAGWAQDTQATKQQGQIDLLFPEGQTAATFTEMIAIFFQQTEPDIPGLRNLTEFVGVNMEASKGGHSDLDIELWEPSRISASIREYGGFSISYLDSYGRKTYRRMFFLGADNGFFTVLNIVSGDSQFDDEVYDDFFNSITVELPTQQGDVTLGPNFQKGQTSETPLCFEVPNGWVEDKEGANANGLHAVLLPKGEEIANTRAAITIAFQRKIAEDPKMSSLGGFIDADLKWTRSQFPDAQIDAWLPESRNTDELTCQGFIIYSNKARTKLSPCIVVFIDSGDGFYSIVATENAKHKLETPLYEEFFLSLRLER